MIRQIDRQGMARLNRAAVVRLIRQEGGLSRAELARRLALTATTLTDIAGELLAGGILREAEEPPRGVGRPATQLRLNADWAHVVTVSMTHSLSVGLVDLAGRLVREETLARAVWGRRTYSARFNALVTSGVARMLAQTRARVLGVGVLSAGRVNKNGIVTYCGNLPRRNLDMRDVLRPVSALPVNVDEEFRLLLLDYAQRNDLPSGSSAVAMSAGIAGYGGGHALYFNGQLYYGADGFAGNPYLPLLHGEPEVRDLHLRVQAMGGEAGYLDAVRAKQPEAAALYRMAVENYGYRLMQLAHNFNPDLVLVYSPYAALGEAFLDDVRTSARQHADKYSLAGLTLRLAGQRTDRERLAAAAAPVISEFLAEGDFLPALRRPRRTAGERFAVSVRHGSDFSS